MIISASFEFKHHGLPAWLNVYRNSGYCWGRITYADARRKCLDVAVNRDLYDFDDYFAAEKLINAANRKVPLNTPKSQRVRKASPRHH